MHVARHPQAREPRTVRTHVVLVGDDGREVEHRAASEQHARTDDGMLLDAPALLRRQYRLREQFLRQLRNAHVVQQASAAHRVHVARRHAQPLTQRHGENRHVDRVQRIGCIVPGKLQHRQQQLSLGMHRHGERRNDRLDLIERHTALARALIQLADDVRLLRQPVRDAATLRVNLRALALRRRVHAHDAPAHAAPRLQGAAGAAPAEESRHEVVEECVERLPRHGRIDFHALHPDVGEAGRPLPPLELVQRAAVAHHRFAEKR